MNNIFITVAASLSICSVAASAATFRGELEAGNLDSSVGAATFISRSPIGAKIFAACQAGEQCEIQGAVDKNGNLTSVESVKKLGGAAPRLAAVKALGNKDIIATIKSAKTDPKISSALANKTIEVTVIFENRPKESAPVIFDKSQVYFDCEQRLSGPSKSAGKLSGTVTKYETSDGDGDPYLYLRNCKFEVGH